MDEAKRKRRTAKAVLTRRDKTLRKRLKESRTVDEVMEAFHSMKAVFDDLVMKHREYAQLIQDDEAFEEEEKWLEESEDFYLQLEMGAKDYSKAAVENGKSASNNGKLVSDSGTSASENGKSVSDSRTSASESGKLVLESGLSEMESRTSDLESGESASGMESAKQSESLAVESGGIGVIDKHTKDSNRVRDRKLNN